MEIDYKGFSVRIIHNPNDIIVRFTDVNTMRLWQTVLTERDFVEYQVLGGLEFAVSLLKDALKSDVYEMSDFKTTPKQLSFTIQYAPDEHCKQINIEFLLPAIKKETANTDMEFVSKKIALLEKGFAEQTKQLATLKEELYIQKEKSEGHIILPGCPFSISEDIVTVAFGLLGSSNPITGNTYLTMNDDHSQLARMLSTNVYHVNSFSTIKSLKYLKKCESLHLVSPTNLKDFSPIGEMISLKSLNIILNTPSEINIEWIKKLSNLETVTLYNCKITDISPLTQLKNLKTLDIRGSGIQNISGFGSHVGITR